MDGHKSTRNLLLPVEPTESAILALPVNTPQIRLEFLSGLRIVVDAGDRGRTRTRTKVAELLLLLVLADGGWVSRKDIASLLWRGVPEPNASDSLRQHLTHVKRAMGDAGWRLKLKRGDIALDVSGIVVDFREFREAIAAAGAQSDEQAMVSALQLYQGDLLPKSNLQRVRDQRRRLREFYICTSVDLADRMAAAGALEVATGVLDRTLDVCPDAEAATALLLRLCRGKRERERIYRNYLKAVGGPLLAGERVRNLYSALAPGRPATGSPSTDTASESDLRLPDNVPVPPRAIIGRNELLARIEDRLSSARLVVLTGAAGIGKTRILWEIARRTSARYKCGAAYVDLSCLELTDRQDLMKQVAAALSQGCGLDPDTNLPLRGLVDGLRGGCVLLLIDSGEHAFGILPAILRTLLERCSGLAIIVASRIELAIEYGAVIGVPPLPVPATSCSTLKELRRSPATELFEQTAVERREGYAPKDTDAFGIARILNATDGVPQDILLAASVRSASLRELGDLLDSKRGSLKLSDWLDDPDLDVRRSTALNVSLRLLSPAEARLLAGISIFPGEFFREAADALALDKHDEGIAAGTLLDRLVARSLVERRELQGRSLFRLLSSVREYAADRLLESGEGSMFLARHLEHCLASVERLTPLVGGRELTELLDQLYIDLPNLKEALDYALEAGAEESEKALRLVAGMVSLFYSKGHMAMGDEWMSRVLDLSDAASPTLRRKVLHGVATIAYLRNRYDRAERYWTMCATIARDLDNAAGLLQDEGNLGLVARAANLLDRAEELFTRCLSGYEARGNRRAVARSLGNLALVAEDKGLLEHAIDLYSQSVEIFRDLQDPYSLALSLHNLGCIHTKAGMFTQAYTRLAEALETSRDRQDRANYAACICGFFKLALKQGDPERAAILYGMWIFAMERAGLDFTGHDDSELAIGRQSAIESLGEDEFESRSRAGRSAETDQVFQFALYNAALNIE